MKCPRAFNSLIGTAAFLLPLLAGADSHLGTPGSNGTLNAGAHVDFKIVIPQVLSLQTSGAQHVAIMSNSRSASVSAGTRTHDADNDVHNSSSVILSATAGHVIAQDAECAGTAHRAPASQPVICTASMP